MSYINPRSKLFQHPERLAMIKAGLTPPPVNIEIDLSNRCSLGCSWCHFAYTHTKGPLAGKVEKPANSTPGGDLMDPDLIYGALSQFKQAGVLSVTWTGGGEPTLHKHFDSIIIRASQVGLDQGLYTHGGHISESRARLLKRKLTFVYVSLDAANAAAYKRDKGVDRFKNACEGIKLLSQASGDAVIGAGFLLTEQNWRDYAEMILVAQMCGADYCQFRPTILYEADTPSLRVEQTGWMTEALEELSPLAGEQGVEIDLARFHRYQSWAGHGYETCHWATLQSVMTPNGQLWTCVNKREYDGEMIGDLTKESFAEIWARHTAPAVNDRCRLLCRGDVANQALDEMMTLVPHANFP